MRILVIADKWIGLNCVKHLLDVFPQDEYRFLLGNNDSKSIADLLVKYGQSWESIESNFIEELHLLPDQHFDWLLNLWGSYIFKPELLDKVKMSLNIHPSFLPFCRGRDPVVWALRNGWPVGASLHVISPRVDEGDIFYQEEVHVKFPFRGEEIYQQVADKSWQIFTQNWPCIRSSKILPTPQKNLEGLKTFKRKDLLVDQVLDLDQDPKAMELIRRFLAHDFGSSYGPLVAKAGKLYRVKLNLIPIQKETI